MVNGSSGGMSLLSRAMPTIMRLRRSNRHHRTRAHVERRLAHLVEHPATIDPPRRLRRDVVVSTSQRQGWTVHEVMPVAGAPRGTVLYLHGGAWMNEAVIQHWRLIAQIAADAQVRVILPVYPLVQHGGTAQTVTPVSAQIAADIRTTTGAPLILMGDSAGGTIALSAALLLRDRGAPPDLTLLIAPALDLRMRNPQIEAVQPLDPWLVKKGLLLVTERWIGEHSEDPVLNPFLADARGLGPLTIYSGTRDLLNPDTRLFVERLRSEGIDVDYHEAPGQLHVHPLLPTPEGRTARREIVRAVQSSVGRAGGGVSPANTGRW